MSFYAAVNSFNAGELSPKMLARTDVAQYTKGCRVLQNFFVTPYGAVERRPGTRFVAHAGGDPVRLIRFVVASDVSYVLEFGHKYIHFFKDGEILGSNEFPNKIDTPYSSGELRGLQFVQSADVMTIVHPNHPVMELRRTDGDNFELREKPFAYPPMLDPNLDDDLTITPSALTGNITLTASRDIFESDNEEGYFQLDHVRQENEIEIDYRYDNKTLVLKGDGTYTSSDDALAKTLEVYGFWTFTTHGTWTGKVTIERSFDGGVTWKAYRTYSSSKDTNVSTSGEEEGENVLYRIFMDDYEQSSTGTLKMCRCSFVNADFIRTGIVRITSVTDGKHADGKVIKILGGTTATNEWSEGAWSDRRGYPRTVAFFEERMMFGGTSHSPGRVWGSKTNHWDDFLLGDKDDSGLDFTLSSDTVNSIIWMCQHDALIIGTEDSEWTLSASSSDSALTPSNFRVRRQSVYGSAPIAAQMVGDTVLFVQRGGRKVREFVYQWEKDGYTSPDMTILADHITATGVIETQLQQLPDSILWCVLANGTVAALTYERDQEVIGWHRHVTDGEILSVCVVPDGDTDVVYFAVRRGDAVFIEYLAPRTFNSIGEAFFVDAGVEQYTESAATDVVTGLGHLDGFIVQILADGMPHRELEVSGGTVTLDDPAHRVIVGLGYESKLSPMPIELESQNGQSMLRRKICGELRVRCYNSVGGQARAGSGAWQQIISRDVLADFLDLAVSPKTEVVTVTPLGGYETSTTIEVRQDEPLPLNITTIVTTYEVVE